MPFAWREASAPVASVALVLAASLLYFCTASRQDEEERAAGLVGAVPVTGAAAKAAAAARRQKGIGRAAIAGLGNQSWTRPSPVQSSDSKTPRLVEARSNSRWAFKDVAKVAASLRGDPQKKKEPQMWRDAAFPPEDSSLFKDPLNPPQDWLRDGERGGILRDVGVEWRGPEAFCPTKRPLGKRADGQPTWLYCDSDGDGAASALDVKGTEVCQGSLGDCYLLCALASATCDMCLCDDLIDEEFEDVGIYGVSFFVKGRWEMVWVDRHFPCFQPPQGSHGGRARLIFASCEDPREIWPLVVEKAYAKLHGSYEDLSGGRIVEALCALTGGHGVMLDLQSPLRSDDGVWSLLSGHEFGQGGVRFVGAGSLAHVEEPQANGIVAGHAYTMLAAREFQTEDGTLRLVKLRNPWNTGEWHGPWGDGSRLWRSELGRKVAAEVQYQANEDGEFWMPLQDFLSRFQTLDICDTATDGRDDRLAMLRSNLQAAVSDAHQEIRSGVEDNRSIDDLLADIEGETPKGKRKKSNYKHDVKNGKDVKGKRGKKNRGE